MDKERFERVDRILRSALSLDAEARDAFLAKACRGDESLRRAVESLLMDDVESGWLPRTDPLRALQIGMEETSETFQRIGPYNVTGTLGEGGMGIILKVWDEELKRDLALKLVKWGRPHEGDPTPAEESRKARFLEEAQITGQLDHPGVVPVHGLGRDEAGRAFFTMQVVRGLTFKNVIEKVHEGDGEWSQTRALNILSRACEALAYAHSKNVIHRDLKPANIMVGKFGEAYVMDWGLAKVLGEEDLHDIRLQDRSHKLKSSVRTERSESDSDSGSPLVTADGEVVGTPAYMAPEQARGEIEAVGPQADVYAMGAVLYHLLSGQLPYVKPGSRISSYTVLAMVIHGPPDPLEQIARNLPVELVAICERAMERNPEARYRDMTEMVTDLRAFLESRVVTAYKTGPIAELHKWVVRNRAAAFSIAAVVLITLGSSVLVSLVTAAAKNRVAQANDELESKNAALIVAHEEADVAQAEAEQNFDAAWRAINRIVRLANEDLVNTPSGSLLRTSLLNQARDFYTGIRASRSAGGSLDLDTIHATISLAMIHLNLGEVDRSEDLFVEALASLSALDERTGAMKEAELYFGLCCMGLGDLKQTVGQYDESETQLEKAIAIADGYLERFPKDLDFKRLLSRSLTLLGSLYYDLGIANRPEKPYLKAIEVNEDLDDFAARVDLSLALRRLGLHQLLNEAPALAETSFQEAVDCLRPLIEHPSATPWTRHHLSHALLGRGRAILQLKGADAAIADLTEGFEYAKQLHTQFPEVSQFQWSLAGAHWSLAHARELQGDHEKASERYLVAIQLQRDVLSGSLRTPPSDYSDAAALRNDFAIFLDSLGRIGEATETYEESIEFLEQIPEEFKNATHLKRLAQTLSNLATLLERQGETLEAEVHVSEAVRILESMLDTEADGRRVRVQLAQSLSAKGYFLIRRGELSLAHRTLERAVELNLELWEGQPGVPERLHRLNESRVNLAYLLRRQSEFEAAIEVLSSVHSVDQELIVDQASHQQIEYWRQSFTIMGGCFKDLEQLEESAEAYEKAIRAAEANIESNSNQPMAWSGVGGAYNNWAEVLMLSGNLDAAKEAFETAIIKQRKALAMGPELTQPPRFLTTHLFGLVRTLLRLGAFQEAVDTSQELLELGHANVAKLTILAREMAERIDEAEEDERLSSCLVRLLVEAAKSDWVRVTKILEEDGFRFVRDHELWRAFLARRNESGTDRDDG